MSLKGKRKTADGENRCDKEWRARWIKLMIGDISVKNGPMKIVENLLYLLCDFSYCGSSKL